MSTVVYTNLRVGRLVGGLERLSEREDRAALAALRRGLGKPPGAAAEMFPVLVPLLGDQPLWSWDEQCAYGVASLYALHVASGRGEGTIRHSGNLGASLNQLAKATESDGPERRFVALLNSDRKDMFEHLRSIVSLLKAHDIGIDWFALTSDVLRWDLPDRRVQRRWATEFWGNRADTTVEAEGGDDEE